MKFQLLAAAFLLAALPAYPAYPENPYLNGSSAGKAEKPVIARSPTITAADPADLVPVRIPPADEKMPPPRPALVISNLPSFLPGTAHDLRSSVFGDVTAGNSGAGVLLKVESGHCKDAKSFFKDAVASEWNPEDVPGGDCWLLLKGWRLSPADGSRYILQPLPQSPEKDHAETEKPPAKKTAKKASHKTSRKPAESVQGGARDEPRPKDRPSKPNTQGSPFL